MPCFAFWELSPELPDLIYGIDEDGFCWYSSACGADVEFQEDELYGEDVKFSKKRRQEV